MTTDKKAVLISIKPKYCELIATGQKTIEVRKTKPKLEVPFKAYIYCTKDKPITGKLSSGKYSQDHIFNGKVIGEFICDQIYNYSANPFLSEKSKTELTISDEEMEKESFLSKHELRSYEERSGNSKWGLLGWHISNLVIYDKPKELSEFSNDSSQLTYDENGNVKYVGMKRPPQSWCYVGAIKNGA